MFGERKIVRVVSDSQQVQAVGQSVAFPREFAAGVAVIYDRKGTHRTPKQLAVGCPAVENPKPAEAK